MIKLLEKYIKEQLDNNVWYLNNENKYETIVAKQIEHFITIDVMFYDDDGIIKVKNFTIIEYEELVKDLRKEKINKILYEKENSIY